MLSIRFAICSPCWHNTGGSQPVELDKEDKCGGRQIMKHYVSFLAVQASKVPPSDAFETWAARAISSRFRNNNFWGS
jgi:hypothetical protein